MATSICRRSVTICSGFDLDLGMTSLLPQGWSLSFPLVQKRPVTSMGIKNSLGSAIVATGLSVLLFAWVVTRPEAQPAPPSVQIDADDIGGVVRGKNGPEAGVWVIAQTTELGTRFAKMVVTD